MSVNIDATTARVNSPAKKKTPLRASWQRGPIDRSRDREGAPGCFDVAIQRGVLGVMQGCAGRRHFFDGRGRDPLATDRAAGAFLRVDGGQVSTYL